MGVLLIAETELSRFRKSKAPSPLINECRYESSFRTCCRARRYPNSGQPKGHLAKNVPQQLDIELEGLLLLSLCRAHGEDIADHTGEPHSYGQAVIEVAGIVVDLGQSHDVL